jgi:hypothetical protein
MTTDRGRSACFGVVGVALLLLSLAACHVRLVSDYDDQLVKDATAVQTDADTLLEAELNPPSGTETSYAANRAAYNKIAVDLDSLRTQAMSHPNNDLTIAQVGALAKTIEGLQQEHMKHNVLPPTYILQKQADIEHQVSLIIRTENDKRSGNAGA